MPKSKRRIERIMSRIHDTTIDSTRDDFELHDCEDAKTLIRLRGELIVYSGTEILSPIFGELLVHVAPNNTLTVTPATAQALDAPVPVQEIMRIPFMTVRNLDPATVFGYPYEIKFDTKVMRKFKQNDRLYASVITNSTIDMTMYGNIYAWFKE